MGKFAASLTCVIVLYFVICFVCVELHTVSQSVDGTEPHTLCLAGKVILETDVHSSCSVLYCARTDSGTLTGQSAALQCQYPVPLPYYHRTDVPGLAQSTDVWAVVTQ
jgi:hypothetical protein